MSWSSKPFWITCNERMKAINSDRLHLLLLLLFPSLLFSFVWMQMVIDCIGQCRSDNGLISIKRRTRARIQLESEICRRRYGEWVKKGKSFGVIVALIISNRHLNVRCTHTYLGLGPHITTIIIAAKAMEASKNVKLFSYSRMRMHFFCFLKLVQCTLDIMCLEQNQNV